MQEQRKLQESPSIFTLASVVGSDSSGSVRKPTLEETLWDSAWDSAGCRCMLGVESVCTRTTNAERPLLYEILVFAMCCNRLSSDKS